MLKFIKLIGLYLILSSILMSKAFEMSDDEIEKLIGGLDKVVKYPNSEELTTYMGDLKNECFGSHVQIHCTRSPEGSIKCMLFCDDKYKKINKKFYALLEARYLKLMKDKRDDKQLSDMGCIIS